jgi:glycosyltransferase involved in cell wall biosynthesis
LNILLVIADLALGGAQQVVINLANELVNQNHKVWIFDIEPEIRSKGMLERVNHKVHIISKNYMDFKLSYKEKFADFILNKLNIKTDNKKKRFSKHEKTLIKTISNNKIDIINSHVCWADFYVYQKLKSHHKNWIITLHASYINFISENGKKYIKVSKSTLLTASKVIFIDSAEKDFLENFLKIKIRKNRKIYNGCQVTIDGIQIKRKDLGLKNNDFVLLCASRAIKEKGWIELCESVIRLKKSNLKLIFAGEGPILEEIKKQYSSFKAITFLGFQNHINDLILLSDLVCLPSYYEALPTILMEALFLKRPVIATDVGETRKIIENDFGKCGILIKPVRDEKLILELSKVINCFLEGNTSFNDKAFEKAKQIFSLEKMAKDYLAYFKE